MLRIEKPLSKNGLILAPLSGTTDLPFRTIARAHGCKFAFYEMLDSSGLVHGHKRTLKMLETTEDDSPIGAQILGSDPVMVLDAAQIVIATTSTSLRGSASDEATKDVMSEGVPRAANLKLIDLNCACPAKKVIRKKAGAYLLKDPKKASKIIKKMASSLPLPVSIKLRSGWAKDSATEGLKLAKIAQENGAKVVFMHGRSVSQGYSGRVNYAAIAEAKKTLKIPIIASGDILNGRLAKEMLDRTGCDGLLIARGGIGNPWIFRQIEAYLTGKSPPRPSYEEIKDTVKEHLKLYREWQIAREKTHNEKIYIGHMRKIAMWYSKGLPYAKRAREAISKAESYDEIVR